jgi:hypothetical protein
MATDLGDWLSILDLLWKRSTKTEKCDVHIIDTVAIEDIMGRVRLHALF